MSQIIKNIRLKLYLSRRKYILDYDDKINIIDVVNQLELEDMSEDKYELIERIENLDSIDYKYNNSKDIQLSVNTSAIESNPGFSSRLDRGLTRLRFRYEGPSDSKNRDFCSYMMTSFANKYFRIEDIDRMSLSLANPDFKQYSIFDYKGSYNCRHAWVAYRFRMKDITTIDTITRSASDSSQKNTPV